LKYILFQIFIFSAQAKENVSPFKKELLTCFKEEFTGSQANNLTSVYAELEKKYQLLSTTLLVRETEFKEQNETKRLKYADGKLKLFTVLDDETLKPSDNDLRQKDRTIEESISQLLIHANIQSDWMKTSETRAGHRLLTIVRTNGEIKSLQFEKISQKKQLFCNRETGKNESQGICSCRDPK
jgi:hypothetical protein